jgi:hypothetical protein
VYYDDDDDHYIDATGSFFDIGDGGWGNGWLVRWVG